ncbi:phospholipase D family protein [Hippea sp. KM1]|uniref:phospholipase D family protein n=1 Tax=Hippea sp. KM1 TaxID=944481 RepID=UPI00046D452D|nr:phospholipase D family protein [Hippea sp. KM1]
MDILRTAKKVKYLNTILNDEPFEGKIDKLFEGFDDFWAITFVSSPRFFFDFVLKHKFQRVRLIIGIEDNDINDKFNLINPEPQHEFFKSLPDEAIEKIRNDEIQIRYSKLGITTHSKLFILKNNSNTRAVFGSANLTQKALSNKNQFEEIIAYDRDHNPNIVKLMETRFEQIWSESIDYVPERIKKEAKPTINVFSTETALDLLKENLSKLSVVGVSSQAIEELISEANIETDTIEYKKEYLKNSKDIINTLTKKTKNGIALISPREVPKKQQLISVKITRLSRRSDELDLRREIVYNETDDLLYIGFSDTDTFERYSEPIDEERITRFIKKIDMFVEAYEKFTIGSKKLYSKQRVFEAILYAFSSPFLWKIREIHAKNKGRDTALSDIPPFLVIAGQAWTGKTHLLEFISRLLGTQGRYFHYNTDIKPANVRDYFFSENIFPILIDEITKDYFTSSAASATKGESFVKSITNSLTGKHPCLIATTNTEFNANMQIIRRIYYLQINKPFDKTQKSQTDDYFSAVIEDIDDSLFKDFSFKFSQLIKNEEDVVKDGDYLNLTRQIFKEYFKIAGIDKPDYFIDKPLLDYYHRGSFMWRNLFQTKRDGFKIQKNMVIVDPTIVFNGDRLEKEKAKKFLDIGVVLEDSVVLVLDKDKFFDFIELNKKQNFFERIGNLFKS